LSRYPKIKLSEIRRIGWRDWDPFGMSDGSEFGPQDAADEYDHPLLQVVNILTAGGSRAEAVRYLLDIVRNDMGRRIVDANATQKTVDAIAGYLKELPDSPPIAD
jgi:hypothetical protein